MPTFFLIVALIAAVWISPQALAQGPEGLFPEGKKLFENTCADCHRANGQGLPNKFPALDKNPFVLGDPAKVIDTVLQGRKGSLGQMPTWKDMLNDNQAAAVITYIRQGWSNKGSAVTPEAVKKRRK
jgi:mono/diheme cytochrome c family protein